MNTQRDAAFLEECKKQDERNDRAIRQWLNKEDTAEARRIERFFTEGRRILDQIPLNPPPGGFRSLEDLRK